MATKLIHLNNSIAGKVPLASELTAGQIAINTADKKIYSLASDGTVFGVGAGGGGGAGTVTSVNNVSPDGTGNITLTPGSLGATTVGSALFTAASAAAARTTLGATTVGSNVFTAATAAAAQTAIGASSVGSAVFSATDAPTAVSALGGSSVGSALFTAVGTAAAQTAIGATATGSSILTAASAGAVVTLLGVIPNSAIGANSGVAPLDSSGKIPTSILPASILGGVNYQGTFVPGTSTLPAASSSNKGFYYVTTAAGTYTPPGGTQLVFNSGDWLISDGAEWTALDTEDAVSSVNGKTGAVVIAATDITTGVFAMAQLGLNSALSAKVLTTDGSGTTTWVTVLPALNHGANSGANRVLITDSSSNPTWSSLVPVLNLPVATAGTLGAAQAGTGLSVAGGIFSVNTAALTLDEGAYVGA